MSSHFISGFSDIGLANHRSRAPLRAMLVLISAINLLMVDGDPPRRGSIRFDPRA